MGEYIVCLLIEPIFRHTRPFSSASTSTIREPSPPPEPNLGHDKPDQPTRDYPNVDVLQNTSRNNRITDTSSDRRFGATRHLAADRSSNDVVQVGNMNDQDSHRIDRNDVEAQLESQTTNASLYNSANGTPSAMTVPLDRYDRQLHELPEDDGMRVLRRKIHAIRDNRATSSEKARLIHTLMTENYDSTRKHYFRERQTSLPRFPSSLPSLEQSNTPSSPRLRRSFDQLSLDHAIPATAESTNNEYNLTPADLEPTYAPRDIVVVTNNSNEEPLVESTPIDIGDDNSDYSDENVMILGCEHYKRNVKLQCYTCKKWYTCRFCHDQVEDHALIRRKTENMLCMLCCLPQPAAQYCRGCDERAASYFCEVCKLWDNDSSKSIYHCNDCGICRIGQGIGKDFYHCKVWRSMLHLQTNAHIRIDL
jgi:uncharacterized CHY-type Zn-finger protein